MPRSSHALRAGVKVVEDLIDTGVDVGYLSEGLQVGHRWPAWAMTGVRPRPSARGTGAVRRP